MQSSNFDDDPRIPCAPGLVAATFALMTTWATPVTDQRCDARRQRALIGRKIVANLGLLQSHPGIGLPLRQVIGKVHERWALLAHEAASATQAEPAAVEVAAAAAPARWH
jgi:hypothetical protein